MDHAKEADKEPTARKQTSIFSMNGTTLPTDQVNVASRPNRPTTTKSNQNQSSRKSLLANAIYGGRG